MALGVGRGECTARGERAQRGAFDAGAADQRAGHATEQQRAANARAFRERVQEQGLDVAPCRVLVKVYNEDRPRPRSIGAQHIGGDELTAALDALEEGDAAGASEAFGRAWLDAYGMDDVDATITDVVGTFGATF